MSFKGDKQPNWAKTSQPPAKAKKAKRAKRIDPDTGNLLTPTFKPTPDMGAPTEPPGKPHGFSKPQKP